MPLLPVFFASIAVASLTAAAWTLWRQMQASRKLSERIVANACPAPSKLASVAADLCLLDYVTCVGDSRLFAFCWGVYKPRICISVGLVKHLSEDELKAVLLHERCHLQNRDPLSLLLVRVVTGALHMLPVFWEICNRHRLKREIEADRVAVQGTSLITLANALLKVLSSGQQLPELRYAPVGNFDVTQERVARLSDPSVTQMPPFSKGSLASSLFVVGALFLSTVGVSEASGYWASVGHHLCRPSVTYQKEATSTSEYHSATCVHTGTSQSDLSR